MVNRPSNNGYELLEQAIKYVRDDISEIKSDIKDVVGKVEKDFIKKVEFDPVRKIVYGMVGVILVAVVSAIIGLVLMK